MYKWYMKYRTCFANFFQSNTNCVVSPYANLTKWSNILKQFVDNFLTNCCLSVFGHFVGLALKGLI